MRALLLGTILLAACNTGPRFRVDAQQVALFEVDVEGDAHALDGPTFRLTPAAFNDLVF